MIEICPFIGAPINFHNKCYIYPPRIVDVVTNDKFSIYLHLLTIEMEDLEEQFMQKIDEGQLAPTPFEYLLMGSSQDKDFRKLIIDAFKFFIHEDIEFLYEKKAILIGNIHEVISNSKSVSDIIYIAEEDFFDFQNKIRLSVGLDEIEPPEPINPHEHPKVRAMKAKARYRDRIKRKKGSNGGISLKESIVAICCMGIGISPLNIGEMSFASINEIMTTYQRKEKYDIDVRSLLAGAKKEKVNPKYWMKKQ